MQHKFSKRPVYLTERSKLDREFIYLHMSNHYRRIVNAKKAIDNSTPTCFKGKRPATSNPGVTRNKINRNFESLILTDRSLSTNSNKDSFWGGESFTGGSRYHARCVPEPPPNISSPKLSCDLDLIDRIAFDTKHGPSAYSDKGWSKMKDHPTEKRYTVTATVKENKPEGKPSPVAKRTLSTAGNNERTQKRKFSIQVKTDNPRNSEVANNLEAPHCKCTKICICEGNETVLKKMTLNPKEQSITSSRDSAYNGGVSSVPESRSPTPDQRRKKDCCCCCCERMKQIGKLQEATKLKQPSVAASAISAASEAKKSASSPRPKSGSKTSKTDRDSYQKMQNDALYVTFIQEITTEVLEKNLYTNKALKMVMKKHLQKNLNRLNKDRMLQELENLRIQLGIPEDKTLFDPSVDYSESLNEDVSKYYPVISDSEFVMPAVSARPSSQKSSEKLVRSISGMFQPQPREISSETDDCEEILAAMREKQRNENKDQGPIVDMSSDDSDRPSDPKKRSVTKNRRSKYMKNLPTSSSDSELSGSYSKAYPDDKPEPCLGHDDLNFEDMGRPVQISKKTRTVSFLRKPDCVAQVPEMRTRKKVVVSHSEESIVVDIKRNKPKHD